jgi:hypothetical protein
MQLEASEALVTSLPSKPLDHVIAERLLTAVTPLTVTLVLRALTSLGPRPLRL